MKEISSVQNTYIKEVVILQEKSKARRQKGKFVIEGVREILLALEANYVLEQLFFCPNLVTTEEFEKFQNTAIETIKVTKAVYKKIAYRTSTEGILAIAKSKTHSLEQLKLPTKNALLLVAEAPEKPGNIGALLRTVDAANVDAFIIANPKTDWYNPNIIRSSIGTVFTTAIAAATTTQIIEFLQKKDIAIYAAALQNSVLYTQSNFTKPTAIVVGTEATGLSNFWLEHATQKIKIPMQGKIDSINVSVAAGILIFEAKRQRDFM